MSLFELLQPAQPPPRSRASGCRSCWRMSAPSSGGSDLAAMLQEEILAVIAKHIAIDRDKVQVKLDRGGVGLDAGNRYRDAEPRRRRTVRRDDRRRKRRRSKLSDQTKG